LRRRSGDPTTLLPARPDDLINTDGGRYNFTTWAFKINGT
jgi:hypothetical protein